MNDLTVIYYTSNLISDYFANNVRERLLLSTRGIPLISVSQKPITFGVNICVGLLSQHVFNLYQQILTETKTAKTKYVVMAEDDILYSPEHFTEYRPANDVFGYNMNKWGLYTWKAPIFNFKNRHSMSSLIARRNLLIEALEERFNKYPTLESIPKDVFGEPGRYEGHLGVKKQKMEDWRSSIPNIIFSHDKALGYLTQGKKKEDGRRAGF